MNSTSYSIKDNKNGMETELTAHQKLIFSQLKKLTFGQLRIHDNNQVHCFGQDESLIADIVVKDSSMYSDVLKNGSIGAAESYINEHWDTPDLTAVVQLFARNQKTLDKLERQFAFLGFITNRLKHLRNNNTKAGSKKNILAHYDLGNDMYKLFLDERMQYSSAVFETPNQTLEDAQTHKLQRICEQLDLTENDHLLEIGTGWAGLAVYAAEHFGCQVTTTTISDAQYEYAQQLVEKKGLSSQITLLKKDYRDLQGQYDKLVSIEMIEAVGDKYLSTFFQKCESLLKPHGKMLLQAITIVDQRYDYYKNSVDFIQKYIFPGGCLPSISVLQKHLTKSTSMVTQSIFDFGIDYAKTIEHWAERFNNNKETLNDLGYDRRFMRLWNYYLAYCQGGFLEKQISVVHLTAQKI